MQRLFIMYLRPPSGVIRKAFTALTSVQTGKRFVNQRRTMCIRNHFAKALASYASVTAARSSFPDFSFTD